MTYELDPVLGRRTGRTTRIAVNLIDAMLKNPGHQFEIIDHYGTREADRHLADLVCRTLQTLGMAPKVTIRPHNRYFISIDSLKELPYDSPRKPEWSRFGLSKYP